MYIKPYNNFVGQLDSYIVIIPFVKYHLSISSSFVLVTGHSTTRTASRYSLPGCRQERYASGWGGQGATRAGALSSGATGAGALSSGATGADGPSSGAMITLSLG
uniref:Uncharacterized protein n=1 Tax=Glossina brevipalpis TaxID=37001 RepID=A0A1A9WED5_9MUSC